MMKSQVCSVHLERLTILKSHSEKEAKDKHLVSHMSLSKKPKEQSQPLQLSIKPSSRVARYTSFLHRKSHLLNQRSHSSAKRDGRMIKQKVLEPVTSRKKRRRHSRSTLMMKPIGITYS